MSSTPTAWKMDGLELSPQEKLNWLYAKCAELQEEIEQAGGSTVSVTADYTEQTYNNKLATITVDGTATKIYAPKVDVTNLLDDGGETIGTIKIGSTSKTIKMPSTVTQGTQIEMPARVLLGFQTALAQINASGVKQATVYSSSPSNQDDIDFADEMIGEIENGKMIYPEFDMSTGVSAAYPVARDIVYTQDSEVRDYNFYYKMPLYVNTGAGYVLYDLYVELNVHSAVDAYTASGFGVYIYGIMHVLS